MDYSYGRVTVAMQESRIGIDPDTASITSVFA